jgi:hypothetical protein
MAVIKTKVDGRTSKRVTINTGDGQTSPWYQIPGNVSKVAIQVEPAGTAKVQSTIDNENLEAGTSGAEDWPDGEVNAVNSALLEGAAAFRIVSVAGAVEAHANFIPN